MPRDCSPEFPDAGNGRVVRSTLLEPVDTGANNGFRRVEVGFTDFQVNDSATLTLQFVSSAQHLECALASDSLHSLRDPAFRVQLHSVNSLSKENDLTVYH